jgi:hypothetical protein
MSGDFLFPSYLLPVLFLPFPSSLLISLYYFSPTLLPTA